MTSLETLPAPTGQPDPDRSRGTSFSAYRRRVRCPREWSYRYGPHKPHLPDELREDDAHDMKLRGNVLHDAIAAALIAAGTELVTAHRRQPLPGTPLSRYWATARAELGVAWDRYRMPHDRHLAAETVEMLQDVLNVVRVPHRNCIVGVEDERVHLTPGGLTVRYVIDYAFWSGGRVVIVDWKSGIDDPDRVDSNEQLLCYAVWLAADLGVPLETVEISLHSLKLRRAVRKPVPVERALEVAGRLEATMLATLADPDPTTTPGPGCTSCFARRVCPEMAVHYVPAAQV